jgi:flagellar biosynthetic protein FliQ
LPSPEVIEWCQQALWMALVLGGIPLLAALVVGVVVGMVQTITQLHEPVVGLVPRLFAVVVAVVLTLPWLLSTWTAYASQMIGSLPERLH